MPGRGWGNTHGYRQHGDHYPEFGAPPTALIVVPLVGAFFIDISNALIIGFLPDLIN